MRAIRWAFGLILAAALLPAQAETPRAAALVSGIERGGMLPAYHPKHVAGPDRDTDTCPVCKYGGRPAVQVWVNTDDPKNVAGIVAALEAAIVAHRDRDLKAFVTFFNHGGQSAEAFEQTLRQMAEKHGVKNVAITYLPRGPQDPAVRSHRINTDEAVRNTVFVYRDRRVSSRFVNLTADERGLQQLRAAIRRVVQ
ncbi:MAG TPA: hypothetical protein VLH79_04305 [Chthonomonadales bacterium]|nr:hypothetical protein [Chthonomonadales bacterium]